MQDGKRARLEVESVGQSCVLSPRLSLRLGKEDPASPGNSESLILVPSLLAGRLERNLGLAPREAKRLSNLPTDVKIEQFFTTDDGERGDLMRKSSSSTTSSYEGCAKYDKDFVSKVQSDPESSDGVGHERSKASRRTRPADWPALYSLLVLLCAMMALSVSAR
jgi:hypothetical protein